MRNAGSHIAIRDLIASGRIGEILSARVMHAVYLPPHLQGWRIDNPEAGGGVIPDIVVHDADTVRFHLGEDPAEVVAIQTSAGMGEGVEDSVMSVWQMQSGATVMTHESFHPSLRRNGDRGPRHQGFDPRHGRDDATTHGPCHADHRRGAKRMSPLPTTISTSVPWASLPTRWLAKGAPSADGIDGIKSLAVASAVAKAATSGARVAVDYGGV